MPERGLHLSDEELLKECEFSALRSSGPGGQHRNRRDTGVRLKHRATGTTAQAFERRSQQRNREVALHRLRRRLALEARVAVDLEGFVPSEALRAILPGRGQKLGPNNDRFWAGIAELLDVLVAQGAAVAETAATLGLSTGALSRLLLSDPELMTAVNRLREDRGLRALRA